MYKDEKFFDEKVPAKTKLELLIKWAGASGKLSMRYAALKQIAERQAWNNNGAEIFLTVRNNLTHSSPKNRQTRLGTPSEALHETYMLGMDYLKGFIQKLLSYPNPLLPAMLIRKK